MLSKEVQVDKIELIACVSRLHCRRSSLHLVYMSVVSPRHENSLVKAASTVPIKYCREETTEAKAVGKVGVEMTEVEFKSLLMTTSMVKTTIHPAIESIHFRVETTSLPLLPSICTRTT